MSASGIGHSAASRGRQQVVAQLGEVLGLPVVVVALGLAVIEVGLHLA